MPSWILLSLISYLLFAINGVADKFLLTKVVPNPAAFAFYTGVASPLVIVFAPFGLHMIYGKDLAAAILSGLSFFIALYFFYGTFKGVSVSRVLPLQGGLIPIFSLLL